MLTFSIKPNVASAFHTPILRAIEPGNSPQQRGFSATGRPYQRQQFAGLADKLGGQRNRPRLVDRHA